MRARKGVGLHRRGDDGETRRVVEIGNDTSLASSENHRKTLSSPATKAGRLQRACLKLRDSPIKWPAEQFEVLKAAEESERQLLRTMIGQVTTSRGAS
jgi:hypothetical protein